MGNIDGINNNIDWTRPLLEGDIARSNIEAKRANAAADEANESAWAWRRHAEGLNRRCIEALKGQHMALAQKEAWKMTARQLWDRLFPGQSRSQKELDAIAKENRKIVLEKHPYNGPS